MRCLAMVIGNPHPEPLQGPAALETETTTVADSRAPRCEMDREYGLTVRHRWAGDDSTVHATLQIAELGNGDKWDAGHRLATVGCTRIAIIRAHTPSARDRPLCIDADYA